MGKRVSRSKLIALTLAGSFAAASLAAAEDTIKIAYIDPLSGPGARLALLVLRPTSMKPNN